MYNWKEFDRFYRVECEQYLPWKDHYNVKVFTHLPAGALEPNSGTSWITPTAQVIVDTSQEPYSLHYQVRPAPGTHLVEHFDEVVRDAAKNEHEKPDLPVSS